MHVIDIVHIISMFEKEYTAYPESCLSLLKKLGKKKELYRTCKFSKYINGLGKDAYN